MPNRKELTEAELAVKRCQKDLLESYGRNDRDSIASLQEELRLACTELLRSSESYRRKLRTKSQRLTGYLADPEQHYQLKTDRSLYRLISQDKSGQLVFSPENTPGTNTTPLLIYGSAVEAFQYLTLVPKESR